MCCLHIFRLRLRIPLFVLFCRVSWIIERRNLISYCWPRVYAWSASKLRLRVPVFVLFCGVGCIMKQGNVVCAGYASTLGYASKLKLRVRVFVVFCVEGGSLNEAICYVLLFIKLKVKGTGVRTVLSWRLYQ